MADEVNGAPPGAARAELEAERAELQKEQDRIDTLLRLLDDPKECRDRDAARLIAMAIIRAEQGMGLPMSLVDAVRKRDPDGVGRFFGNAACEADGWKVAPDGQGKGPFLWIPETAANALAWPEAVPYHQADANKPEETGKS